MATSRYFYKQARFKLLRTFYIVAQQGSITQAAVKLFISQPTVSLQIQALERELAKTLFERRGPKINLTPEGEILYKLVEPIITSIDSLKEDFRANLGEIDDGELCIAAGHSTALYVLPKYLQEFKRRYPGICVRVQSVTGKSGMEMLNKDEADLAIGPLLQVPQGIIYKPFATYHSKLITPVGHPLTEKENISPKDISPYGLILPPRNLSTWRMVDTVFRQNNARYTVSMEAGGWELVKKYVEMGMGVSIVTDVCLNGDEDIAVIPMENYFPSRDYGIINREGKFLSPQAKRFIEMIDSGVLEESEFVNN